MPRPPLGAAARTTIKSVRVSEEEDRILTAKYGSSGKAIRALINKELRAIKEVK